MTVLRHLALGARTWSWPLEDLPRGATPGYGRVVRARIANRGGAVNVAKRGQCSQTLYGFRTWTKGIYNSYIADLILAYARQAGPGKAQLVS